MPEVFDRSVILAAFKALDEELGARGVRANVFVVGGAAMAVAYDARRSTVDVDAVFAPSREVRAAAQRVAAELGLAGGWLNDGVRAFLPGEDPNGRRVYEGRHLQVAAASPKYLLAMKLLAARVERDQEDIRTLYRLCGFATAAEGLALVSATYPEHMIPARTRFMLEEMYPTPDIARQQPPGHRRGPRPPTF